VCGLFAFYVFTDGEYECFGLPTCVCCFYECWLLVCVYGVCVSLWCVFMCVGLLCLCVVYVWFFL